MFTDDMFQNMNTKWGAEGSAPSRVPAGRMLQGRDFPRIGIIIIIIIIIVIVITISDCKLPEPDNGEGRRMLWDKCSKGELCHGLEGEQPRYGRARCQDNATRYRNAYSSFSSSSSSWASSWQTASSATWPLSLRMALASVLIDSSLLLAVLASNSSSKVTVIIDVVIIILPQASSTVLNPRQWSEWKKLRARLSEGIKANVWKCGNEQRSGK